MCRNTYVHETSARGGFCRLITKLNQWQFGFVSQWSWVQIPQIISVFLPVFQKNKCLAPTYEWLNSLP